MIYSDNEIEQIRQADLLVSKTLAEMGKILEPGISTLQLDKIAEEFIRDHGAEPAFKGYEGFPATLCISENNKIVHGIPSEKIIIKDGDIVSIDCGTILNGFFGDSAYTFPVGEVDEEKLKLMKATRDGLYKGIEAAVAGNRIGDIGSAVQSHVENLGYTVVRELVGHGVGRHLHEKPQVPNYGQRGNGKKIKNGLVIAIEPMINMGSKEVQIANDGWTFSTLDGKPSAHFEHSIAIRNGKADILSDFEMIDKVVYQNK
ncbi:MAG: type I methionyl aminopeptidase [Bacteroidales bacterium]|nr:type I methionyl aminopeptidase [Bacteroidales bacterium]